MKKIMAVLVSVMTGLCVFASCGNSNSSDSGDISSKKVTETTSNDDVSSDDKLLSDDNNEDTQTSTTTTTEASSAVVEESQTETDTNTSDTNKSDFTLGFYNMLGETQHDAETWFRRNIYMGIGSTYVDCNKTNVDNLVFSTDNNNLNLFGVNWGWVDIQSRTTDDYVYQIDYHFSAFDYDRFTKYNLGLKDKKGEEADLAYKILKEKLVEAYGEPTEGYEDDETQWAKNYQVWKDTMDGDICVMDASNEEDGSGELYLIFSVSGFDYSTLIDR